MNLLFCLLFFYFFEGEGGDSEQKDLELKTGFWFLQDIPTKSTKTVMIGFFQSWSNNNTCDRSQLGEISV